MSETYDQDFYAWAMHNADLIRQGRLSEIDVEHIAEELEGMGRSERRALSSRLKVLLVHLLKWRHQAPLRSNSWRYTIREQRLAVQDILQDNPSLAPQLEALQHRAYQSARLAAARETGLSEETFPQDCPFPHEQVMNSDFWPE